MAADDTRPDIPAAPAERSVTATGPAGDVREALGRIVHAERLAANAAKERPFGLLPWEERSEEQRELDMRIGEAVAGIRERFEAAIANAGLLRVPPSDGWRERAEQAEADLAEVRALAADWVATSAPAGEWEPSRTDEVMGSCERAVLAITGTGEEPKS